MSKVANKPVELTSDIKFNITNNIIHIEGPKGKLEFVKPNDVTIEQTENLLNVCLLYTSPSPRDLYRSRMPSSA